VEYSIERLILAGAVEPAGIDEETGEFLYNFTDIAQDVIPQMYKEYLEFLHHEIMYFWELGFFAIDDFAKANPTVSVTQKVLDEDAIASLPPKKQKTLYEILQALRVI
jgi:hypothetical protein